jgi:hypothetical protein
VIDSVNTMIIVVVVDERAKSRLTVSCEQRTGSGAPVVLPTAQTATTGSGIGRLMKGVCDDHVCARECDLRATQDAPSFVPGGGGSGGNSNASSQGSSASGAPLRVTSNAFVPQVLCMRDVIARSDVHACCRRAAHRLALRLA